MTETSQDTSSSSPLGTALVVIDKRLQELAKVPGIDKRRKALGERIKWLVGLPLVLGGPATMVSMCILFPGPTAPVWAIWIFAGGMFAAPVGAISMLSDTFGLKSKADKRHLALQDERKQLLLEQSDELTRQQHLARLQDLQLLLEQSNELRRQQQAAEQKQREEEAEKYRQRCERLKAAAEEKLAGLKDEDRHQGRIFPLSDPDEPSKIVNLGITEVVIYGKAGAELQRLTARLYQAVSSGELLKAPEIEGVGPIHSERPAPQSRSAPPLLLPRPPVKPSPSPGTSELG